MIEKKQPSWPNREISLCENAFWPERGAHYFQRLMDIILGPYASFVRAYIDDIVIFSNQWEDYMRHLKRVFDILRKAGLKEKPAKCSLAMTSCSQVVGNGQVEMEATKTDTVKTSVSQKPRRMFVPF